MGLNLGVFRFLLTTHAKANIKQMRSRSSHTAQCFLRVFVFTLIPQYTHLTNHDYFDLIREKTEDPQIEPHEGIKMEQVLVSLVYICGYILYLNA